MRIPPINGRQIGSESGREMILARARAAYKNSRYSEVVTEISKLTRHPTLKLNKEECELYLKSQKKLISALRHKFRNCQNSFNEFELCVEPFDAVEKSRMRAKIEQVRNDIMKICCETISTLELRFIPELLNDHVVISILKFRADFSRYWTEVAIKENILVLQKRTERYYTFAFNLANKRLKKYDLTRLSILFDLAVYHADIRRDFLTAITLAEKGQKEAVRDSGHVSVDRQNFLTTCEEHLRTWKALMNTNSSDEYERLETKQRWWSSNSLIDKESKDEKALVSCAPITQKNLSKNGENSSFTTSIPDSTSAVSRHNSSGSMILDSVTKPQNNRDHCQTAIANGKNNPVLYDCPLTEIIKVETNTEEPESTKALHRKTMKNEYCISDKEVALVKELFSKLN